MEATEGPDRNSVWLFRLPASHFSARWLPFVRNLDPSNTFQAHGRTLERVPNRAPAPNTGLRRKHVRSPRGTNSRLHWGIWNEDTIMCSQYNWQDGAQLINSSTAQLRLMQARQHLGPHSALEKWSFQIHRQVDEDVWRDTWVPYRSAAENTFLWQLLYRIPATNRWRFPDRPTADPATWCVRCSSNSTEDVLHYIWECPNSPPNSQRCWQWCNRLLNWVSCNVPGNIHLQPAQVLIAEALPCTRETPDRLAHHPMLDHLEGPQQSCFRRRRL